MAAGHIPEARAQADRALRLAPEDTDALVLAARTALSARDPAAAERFLERAVAGNPSSVEAHVMLGQIYASRGDLTRARTTIETVAAKRPDSAAARTALGIVLEAADRPSDARARYEQALAIDPAEPIAANNLARLYASDEARTTEAIELARKAVARCRTTPTSTTPSAGLRSRPVVSRWRGPHSSAPSRSIRATRRRKIICKESGAR